MNIQNSKDGGIKFSHKSITNKNEPTCQFSKKRNNNFTKKIFNALKAVK